MARIRPIDVPPSLRPEECARWLQLKEEERLQSQALTQSMRSMAPRARRPAGPDDGKLEEQARKILLATLEGTLRINEDMAAKATNGAARAIFYAGYLDALARASTEVPEVLSAPLVPPLTATQQQWKRSYDLAICTGNPADLPRERPW